MPSEPTENEREAAPASIKPATRPRNAWLTMPLRTARDIIQAFYDQGLGALVPLVIVLLILAVVLSVLTLAGPVIPFIYPLF